MTATPVTSAPPSGVSHPSLHFPVPAVATHSTVVVQSPAPAVHTQSAVTTGATWVSAAIVAALIAAAVNLWLARRKSLEEERARVRATFADAFQAVADYKEFPYAIRRRRADQPEAERVRLSEALREVQSRLTYYVAWIDGEAPTVGVTYRDLASELRVVAGGACRQAWTEPPVGSDADMNIPSSFVDLTPLRAKEDAYLAAARKHLATLLSLHQLFRRR